MSISTESWESIISLVNHFYDKNIPVYYTEAHLDLTCKILALFLKQQSFHVVRTNVVLTEPLITYQNAIFLSVPLIALLVNKTVELPSNMVEFVENVDLFDGLKPLIQQDLSYCIDKPGYSEEILEQQFSLEETVRFTQILRIIVMCGHFYQHYSQKIPFHSHVNFKNIEIAYMPKEITENVLKSTKTINYNTLLNQ